MEGLPMATGTYVISTESALELATDRTRRRVLRYLIENGETGVRLEELIDVIVGDRPASDRARYANGEQLGIALRHVHLPKLAEDGVVDYDVRSATVRCYVTPRLEKLVRFVGDELPGVDASETPITHLDWNRRTP